MAPLLAACDWLACPTTWTGCDSVAPAYPDVAGTYSGSLTVTAPPPSEPTTGTMEITVLQSDRDITIDRPVTSAGVPLLPGLIGVIDHGGIFTQTGGGADYDPECGVTTMAGTALSFSGWTARYQTSLSTARCGEYRLDATLEKR